MTEEASFTPPTIDTAKLDTVCEAIANRRSLGLARLHDAPVDKAIIERMLEAANWGMSDHDTEPWRFTVFTGDSREELGKAFAEAYKKDAEAAGNFKPETYQAQMEKGTDAPLWIAIGMTPGMRDGELVGDPEEELMAVATAVQNMAIVAGAAGLVGMWHSRTTSVSPHVAKWLGWAPPSRLLGFFFFGWPKVQWPEGERGPISEKVRWA